MSSIFHKEALNQLMELQPLKKCERLKKEVALLPQFAENVPERITFDEFRDLISKMTPGILLYRHKRSETFLHRMVRIRAPNALRAFLVVGPADFREMVDERMLTPLYVAAREGHLECLEILLKDSSPAYREMTNRVSIVFYRIKPF
eukprot:TRINITY_DN485337_c0_g1_i2.p1 TRINITY_DN485337_c0_g1~~TRINITY_DN485337_c0_g1_i2.p1  ORF type:complete len:147 (+),score=26.34 TRINITY_DN485337_c0_g1_i2:234-674(+)